METRPIPQTKALHWADSYAEKIIKEKGEKDLYVCATGITPSGTIHIGNFREMMSVDLVVRALRQRNKKVRFIFSWDDYDVFRKVPKNLPQPEILEQYLRYPIDKVPDTSGEKENYARHFESHLEDLLPTMGIYVEYIYQSQEYRKSRYAEPMRHALLNSSQLAKILNEYRKEALPVSWLPVSIFCENCQKDTTEVQHYDQEWSLHYHCESCAHRAVLDLRTSGAAKLPWRIDWPMRWKWENVDFEPAGKDHHSQGGSFDTSRHVVRVFGGEAPVSFRYDFISIKGRGGKISSSSGEVISLREMLEVYTPQLTRYLFASTRPNAEFAISFDLDVIKNYEDYERSQRIYFGLETVKEDRAIREKRIYELSQTHEIPQRIPYEVSFRHLSTLSQIYEGDIDAVIASLDNVQQDQKEELATRVRCAFNWVRGFAPDDFRFSLRTSQRPQFKEQEEAALEELRTRLPQELQLEEKELNNLIYTIAERHRIESKAFFQILYQALIAKDQGPRLASFLKTIGLDKSLRLLT